jgi:hypothetical protein
LANALVTRQPDNFLAIYRDAHTEATQIPHLTKERQVALLNEIVNQYPDYAAFETPAHP